MVNYGNDAGAGDTRIIEVRRHHPQIQSRIEKNYETEKKIEESIAKEKRTIRLNIGKENEKPTTIKLNFNK